MFYVLVRGWRDGVVALYKVITECFGIALNFVNNCVFWGFRIG